MKVNLYNLGRWLIVMVALSAVAACSSSPTPYQVVGDNGGYSEQQIEDDRYSVKFEGNSATSRDAVEEFALYRAAELTLEQGRDYFKVVSRDVEPVAQSSSGVYPSIGIGVGGGNVGFGVSSGFGGVGRANASYAAYLDIVMYDGEKPGDERGAYTAFDVVENLKPKITASEPLPE